MRRRDFIAGLGGAAAAGAWPCVARAQETGRTYRLGSIHPGPRSAPHHVAFYDELHRLGFVEGQNLTVDPRGYGLRVDELAERARAYAQTSVDAIICGGEIATRAAQQVTATIPILAVTDDMVGSGLAQSLARPGGNTTGVSILATELDGKRQDLLREAVPGAGKIAALADPTITREPQLQELRAAARSLGVELVIYPATRSEEIGPALEAAKQAGAAALNVLASPFLFSNSKLVLERTAALRLPTIHQWPETADEGGLVAYGPRFVQVYRQLARLLVKVLRGALPASLPVEQPTNFELVINLRTAKAIGHEIPAGLVLRADKVIE